MPTTDTATAEHLDGGALKKFSVDVAAYLGETGKAGVIQPGARADFILLDKNPLLNINNSRTISGVFTQGNGYPKIY